MSFIENNDLEVIAPLYVVTAPKREPEGSSGLL